MRRAAVTVTLAIALGSLAAGCDDARPTEARRSTTSGSESRLRSARREMGLGELMGAENESEEDDREELELPFALGPEHLPELPTDVEPNVPPLRDGLARAIDALELARPTPEADLDQVGLQLWVEGEYARWLRARGEALRAAREALATAEQGEIGEYVVASAVIGVLFARLAAAIATMPLPTEVEAEEGDRLRFRQAFLRAAGPLWDRAADAFGACASATVRAGDESLIPWQQYCDRALESAQDAPRPLQ